MMPTPSSVARVVASRVHAEVERFECGDALDASIDAVDADDDADDARSRKTSSPAAVPTTHAVRVSS